MSLQARAFHKFIRSVKKCVVSMSSGTTHLERTSDSSRHEALSDATVEEIVDVSPTVKKLLLKIHDGDFTFSPGQWVDFHVSGLSRVGGFSMCSSPHRLQSQGLMELAVKYSSREPAFWVHTKCEPGSRVQVRVGGDFRYDMSTHRSHDLLLIAGGVGINPLMSVLRTVSEFRPAETESKGPETSTDHPRVVLLYSAKKREELIFQRDIEALCRTHSRMTSQFHITGETGKDESIVKRGRINLEVLDGILKTHFQEEKKHLVCFLCGPGQMIDDMENFLQQLGLAKNQIYFEKWW